MCILTPKANFKIALKGGECAYAEQRAVSTIPIIFMHNQAEKKLAGNYCEAKDENLKISMFIRINNKGTMLTFFNYNYRFVNIRFMKVGINC